MKEQLRNFFKGTLENFNMLSFVCRALEMKMKNKSSLTRVQRHRSKHRKWNFKTFFFIPTEFFKLLKYFF